MNSKENSTTDVATDAKGDSPQESHVGLRVRQLRLERDLSIRSLAEASGLSVNTLSLIENGKISPSVSTLQRAAVALDVPITAFFETPAPQQSIVFLSGTQRRGAQFAHGAVENLAAGFTSRALHPCLVTLEPHCGSGTDLITHTGFEFVYCLQGRVNYTVDGQIYILVPGDSLLFESHLPHRWQNEEETPAQMLLVLAPTDERDRPTQRHFLPTVVPAR